MEVRVTRLEDDVRSLQRDVSDIKSDVSKISGQIPHLATKAQMHLYGIGTIGGIIAVLIGVVTIALQISGE